MKIVHRSRGELVCTSDSLDVSVLTISPDAVTFTICDSTPETSVQPLSRPMADACKNRSCYFWFPAGGRCMLVARCDMGRSGVALGATRLQYLGLRDGIARIVVNEPLADTSEPLTTSAGAAMPAAAPASDRPERLHGRWSRISLSLPQLPWGRVPRLLLGQLAASLAAIMHRS